MDFYLPLIFLITNTKNANSITNIIIFIYIHLKIRSYKFFFEKILIDIIIEIKIIKIDITKGIQTITV